MALKISSIKIPHVFIFLFYIILACSILTYIIPSGGFERTSRTFGAITQNVVVPGSYEQVPKHISLRGVFLGDQVEGKASPVSLLSLLTAIPKGLHQSAVLVFFVFIVGAVFNIIHRTGAINALIFFLIERFRQRPMWLFFLIFMVLFSGSSFMGIVMETIALIPIFIMLSRQLGYDRIFGLSLVVVPVFLGWSTAVTNPFTVQIAQQIAELPAGSGIGMRFLLYIVIALTGFFYLMYYGRRIQNAETAGTDGKEDHILLGSDDVEQIPLSRKHMAIFTVVLTCYAGILFAVQTIGWSFIEMSGGFIGIGILVILIEGMSGDESMDAFMEGLEQMIIPALAVGVARGVSVVLQEGQIIDTILHQSSDVLSGLPTVLAGEGMLIFQTLLNFFIPSASGQALVSMPLMTPLSDLLGISRQTAVLAYIMGDGLSNLIIPTNGVLMAMLGIAGISFEKWFRFVLPVFLATMTIGAIFIAIAIITGY
jgi:uncharacterized ion transporter superfamily protein YfcC